MGMVQGSEGFGFRVQGLEGYKGPLGVNAG